METDQIEAELEAAVASAQRYLPDWATAILVYLVGALIALSRICSGARSSGAVPARCGSSC